MPSIEETETVSRKSNVKLPPTPPETIVDDEDTESVHSIGAGKEQLDLPLPPPSTRPTKVLDVDKPTPDSHVPRDPRLIRLTGTHPFNCEAPLTDLFNEGFLTSPELFYVRNHGAVPVVREEEIHDWEFTVEGLIANPLKITLKELLSDYENVTYPITLVCAGNRREEQNVVRKSKGFSWGPAGVSTALFTGVILKDVIERARPLRKARYLCMEGADKLPNGHYGTSVKLNWAMDPNRGMMLAHKMNGEDLTPDHGKPLRVVIPGQIGGRSVKWLKKLIVTAEPSDNWYHIYDNRVLPTMVDPDEAAKIEKWWTDERYAIYDLSPNSATACPAHNEKLELASAPEYYTLQGYAYSGGGRRVTRVEISLDQGKTWRLCRITYAEDKYREYEDKPLFGGRLDMEWRETCFCWSFWKLDVLVEELKDAKDIVARAMDESMNVQPRDMYWSVLGMMNNPWFRVVIHKEGGTLRFEHPTQPALIPGGWMERVKKAGGDLTNGIWGERREGEEVDTTTAEVPKEIKMTKDGVDREIEIDELRQHENDENPWFVVNGEVYDGTAFLEGHPGGAQSIISAAGQDSTEEFLAIHSETAKAMMSDYHIGTLFAPSLRLLAEPQPTTESSKPRPTFLTPRSWTKAILHSKTPVSWDTRIFTFRLQHATQTLGLPTGQHLLLHDPASRSPIIRPYTPISDPSKRGFCSLLVKLYSATPHRAGGKMTQALDALPIGHPITMKGPLGKFEYHGHGTCLVNGHARHVDRLFMICAGSGITPIFQVLRAVMRDSGDATTCTVLDGNRRAEDILCKEALDGFVREGAGRCRVVYTLTKGEGGWMGLRGRIGAPLVRGWCVRGKAGGSLVLVCGPEGLERSVGEALRGMGWGDDEVVFF